MKCRVVSNFSTRQTHTSNPLTTTTPFKRYVSQCPQVTQASATLISNHKIDDRVRKKRLLPWQIDDEASTPYRITTSFGQVNNNFNKILTVGIARALFAKIFVQHFF
jgi:hypothetical protein